MDSDGTQPHIVQGDIADYEYITPFGYSNSSKCGYCGSRGKSQSKRFSYYATATSLSPKYYQTLLDRYWRRSGKLLYRPNQQRSCCPHYTIRLDSNEFKPSRAQRQTVNRFNGHVLGVEYIKEAARLYPRTKAQAKKRDNEFILSERIHEAEYDRLKTPPQPAHKFSVTLEKDNFTEEKYQVYNNYQATVHHDEPEERTRELFRRFLCSSPLRCQVMLGPDGRKRRLGSYHQCYRLDGKLVAIGVLDLLPDCVSSVYFLYDESIHKYTPGKLGALFEISLAFEEGYRWWYPGFYIHSCPKMRYKNDYAPQYILDPEALTWDPLDNEVLAILDKKPFVSLYQERTIGTENGFFDNSAALMPKKSGDEGISSDVDEGDAADCSVFNTEMPGIPSLVSMQNVPLNDIVVKGRPTGPLYCASNLIGWDSSTDSTKWPRVKVGIAALIATLGSDCLDVLCIDLSGGGD